LCREIAAQGGNFSRYAVDTVYIGGGTPTLLSSDELLAISEAVRENFNLTRDYEWTIEANPETADGEKIAHLKNSGMNRISFGVQTFSDRLLYKIGRRHTAGAAEDAVRAAKKSGFDNISLDLMYALPTQTMAELLESVAKAALLNVSHISIYGLTIEENTVFSKLIEKNRLDVCSEELEEAMYDAMLEKLKKFGFERYEISNFAKNKKYSRHNLKYWQDAPYLGLGAAASSYIKNVRSVNERRIEKYIACIENSGAATEMSEVLSRAVQMEEFCFLSLRKISGIEKQAFEKKFDCAIESVYGEKIEALKKKKLLSENAANIFLTPLGMKYGNRVFVEFMLG
jgi:oxygen-independent coproporphyrinogen-3 oxidase